MKTKFRGVVCGIPRSGTSICTNLIRSAIDDSMLIGSQFPQMTLDQKISRITDEQLKQFYKDKFNSDEADPKPYVDLNPDGFWECRYTVPGITWHPGMPDLTGKFVKIVSGGLAKSDPEFIDKIVYMVRCPHQVAKSQERLSRDILDNENVKIHSPKMYVVHTCAVAKWIVENKMADKILLVNYDNLVKYPKTECQRIEQHFQLNPESIDYKIVKPELKRSIGDWFKNDLFNLAERIYELLKIGDWEAINVLGEGEVNEWFSFRKPLYCERLESKVSHGSCQNCVLNKVVAGNFRKRAEKNGIDWINRPCMFKYLKLKESSLQETISNNHWIDHDLQISTVDKIKGVTNASLALLNDVIKAKNPFVSRDVMEERRAMCNECQDKKGGKCGLCGCNIKAKTALKSQSCPKKIWTVDK